MTPETAQAGWRTAVERLAAGIHAIHGTRSLALAVAALLALSLIEPVLPSGPARAAATMTIFALAVVGLVTLPREAIAVQERVKRLASRPGASRRLARHLLFPLALLVLLSPSVFLAAYGVPHLSPITGLVSPNIQQRVASAFLFLVLLVPILQVRASRRYAPEVETQRPRDLPARAFEHRQRDLLQALQAAIVIVWLFILVPFWSPFSLFSWPPDLASFAAGVRGVSSLCYAVFLPAVLFVHASAHAQALRDLWRGPGWREEWQDVVLLMLHVVGSLAAIVLHAYNLLWIARYQAAVGI